MSFRRGAFWRRVSYTQVLSLPFLAFILLPLIALLVRVSPAELFASLLMPQVLAAARLSLVTSLASTFLTLLAGTPVAYLLAQNNHPAGKRRALNQVVDTIVDLPTVLPPAVAGVALLMAFGRRGLIGALLAQVGISLPFTPAAVILAQTFVAAPFYIRAAALGFAGVGYELRHAAALDGANSWQIFRHLVLPLTRLPMLTGLAMTWARALGEFGATIIFAGNFPGRTQTMPLAIYIGFEINLDMALALSFILVVLSFTILAVVKAFLSQNLLINEGW